MKFITIFFTITILIGASVSMPSLHNKCLSKSSVLLISKPCLPSILSIKQLHFGTPCGRPPHLCTCGTNTQRPAKFQQQHQQQQTQQDSCSSCGGYNCGCSSQPLCRCGCGGPQFEEKDINIKLRIMIPKCCSVHQY